MPFIHIRSLPFEEPFDVPVAIKTVSEAFSVRTEIDLQHISVTWEFFATEHYAHAGQTVNYQPRDSHPILVELIAPDSNSESRIKMMLKTIASILEQITGIAVSNIFIHFRAAQSGTVFDHGDVVHW